MIDFISIVEYFIVGKEFIFQSVSVSVIFDLLIHYCNIIKNEQEISIISLSLEFNKFN
jgi:hypothetical protein